MPKFTKRSAKKWARIYAGDLIRSFLDSDPVILDPDTGKTRDEADEKLLVSALRELANELNPEFTLDDRERDACAISRRSPMAKRFDSLFRWAVEHHIKEEVTYENLASSLSVEGLKYEKIPERLYETVVGFRCLTHGERERRARDYLRRNKV